MNATPTPPRDTARGADDQARALESDGLLGPGPVSCSPGDETGVFGATLYDQASREDVPDAAVNASLGCGLPTAIAQLRDGETVLDLGSGAGADVLISPLAASRHPAELSAWT